MSLTSLRVREDVFYDGDNFLPPVQALHDGLSPLVLDELYLDTSYCSPQYQTFPSRPQSEEKIWELCQKWIRKNGMFKDTRARHVILFHLPPRYGYESILRHVFMKSLRSWQVHVSPTSLNEQLCQSEVSGCVNTDPGVAQWIHACHKADKRSANQPLLKQLPCQLGEFEVCQIKPSTMYFTQSKMKGLEAAGHDRLVSVSQGGSNYRYWEQHIWLSLSILLQSVLLKPRQSLRAGDIRQTFLSPSNHSLRHSSQLQQGGGQRHSQLLPGQRHRPPPRTLQLPSRRGEISWSRDDCRRI